MTDRLQVAIDAQVTPGMAGGIALFVRSLVRALGQLTDGSESYRVIVRSEQQRDWLSVHLGPNQTLVMKSQREPNNKPPLLRRVLKPFRPAVRYMRQLMHSRISPEVPMSNGFYESLGCDVVHFPTQGYVSCALPTVYNPHDLQHLHFPEFFTPPILAWREAVYPAGCQLAKTVVVGSEWVKTDVVRHFRIRPDKVQVIREAPSTESFPEPTENDLSLIQRKYALLQPIALYPAVTWSHKNHIRLLQALAYLRDTRGLLINLVCTGSRYDPHWPPIQACLEELKLSPQAMFLGFVPEDDLRAIYRVAQFLVLPSLFEANSLPIFEAWLEGVPVTCSNIPALQEQVGDAAHLFNPQQVGSIADAVARLSTDVSLQEALRARGYQRVKEFNWERTAKAYRAVYRRAAGYPLTDEDRWLLKGQDGSAPQHTMEYRNRCQENSSL
jgi:glycosyltransferase involved in cell wall biosynthesis